LLRAIEQFNQHEYFECHETLEALWHVERDLARTFARTAHASQPANEHIYCDNLYKGILQVGVGCYHLLRNNYRGATIKLQTGADYLEPFVPRCMGVEVEQLIADARRLREVIVSLGPGRLREVDLSLLPIVRIASV
jgi:predicted metal-dependent hydrolase